MLQISPRQSPDNAPRPGLGSEWAPVLERGHGLRPFVTDGVGGVMTLLCHLKAEHTIRHVND